MLPVSPNQAGCGYDPGDTTKTATDPRGGVHGSGHDGARRPDRERRPSGHAARTPPFAWPPRPAAFANGRALATPMTGASTNRRPVPLPTRAAIFPRHRRCASRPMLGCRMVAVV